MNNLDNKILNTISQLNQEILTTYDDVLNEFDSVKLAKLFQMKNYLYTLEKNVIDKIYYNTSDNDESELSQICDKAIENVFEFDLDDLLSKLENMRLEFNNNFINSLNRLIKQINSQAPVFIIAKEIEILSYNAMYVNEINRIALAFEKVDS